MAGRFSIDAVFRAIDRYSAPVRRMQASTDRFARAASVNLKEVNKVTGDIHNGLVKLGTAAIAAGAALGTVAHNIIRTGAEFDQQMAAVGAVSLMTRDQIKELEDKARELGATTKFSATEVAAGMELMGKAGFENKDVIAGIEGVLAAAAAEGAELAETAGHISNVLKGMGLEARESGRVADVLALASARTNSSISSLGESMANVSSTARQFNIPLEQVVGSVALLQDVGLDASVAGSALNTMLTKLATPTDKAKEAMRKLHVEFEDAKGNMLPLTDVFANLMQAADRSKGNMDQVAFFAELVGLRGQKAAQNLADLFRSGKAGKLFAELQKAKGKAEEMAKIRMDTFLGDVEQLSGAVDDLKISIFDMNRGPLRDVVQGMTKWIEANKGVITSKLQEYIDGTVEKLPQILKWTERIGKAVVVFYAIAAAVKVAKVATEAYLLTTRGFAAVTAGIKAMAVAMGLYNAEVAAANSGLTGMRDALNSSKWGMAINSFKKLSVQGAIFAATAFEIGYAIGTWLNDTFKFSDMLADIMAQITGLEAKLGGRKGGKLGQGPQILADGTELNNDGSVKKRGTNWMEHEVKHLRRLAAAGEKLTAEQELMVAAANERDLRAQGAFLSPGGVFDFSADDVMVGPDLNTQMVTPQERTARTIEETNATTTDKVEITVRGEAGGRAEVTKRPKRATVRVAPSGAF